MHSITTGRLLAWVRPSICRHSIWVAFLGIALVLAAPQRVVGTATTFTLSTTWNLASNGNPDPYPIDIPSTIVIDTATGQVVSSHVTASGLAGAVFVLPFQSQQSGTGFTLLTFNGGGTLATGETITITLQVYLPVASLVGYSGGALCDDTSVCNVGGGLTAVTKEVVQCAGSTCQFSEQGTFSTNYSELSGPQTNLTTFRVSANDFCTSVPCVSPVNILGSFTIDLATGIVTNGSMSMIDSADLKSSPLSLPLNLQYQSAPNQALLFRKPGTFGNASSVSLFFPFNSFPTTYSGGPICSQSSLPSLPGCFSSPSGAAIGPADASPTLLAASSTGTNGILTVATATPLPPSSSNPVPFVSQPLVPTAAAPGGAAFTLTVNGTGFVSGATVQWNGTVLTTTFINSSQLTAAVPAANIAVAVTAEITVANPAPGGGLSNVVFFTVSNATRDVAFQAGTVVNGSSGFGNTLQLAVADFGTGKLDLISSSLNAANGTIPYWLGNGDGTFQAPVALTVQTNGTGVSIGQTLDVGLGDFNGDAKQDAILVGYLSTPSPNPPGTEATISFLAGNGNGTFQPFISSQFSSLTQIGPGVAVGDVNGDGHLDVVTACTQFVSWPNRSTYQSGICTFLGNGNGTFNLAFSRFYTYPFTVNSIALGDFNGDGKLDIVASGGYLPADQNPSYVGFFAGNGDGTFAPDKLINETTDSLNGVSGLAAADLNHDGKLDLVFVHDCAAQPSCGWDADFLVGNGDGTFQPPITAHNFPTFSPPIFGDFNADGILDVTALNNVFLLHNGSSTTYPILQSPNRQVPVVVADFNGDGRLDLMATLVGSQQSIQPLLQIAPSPDFDVAVSSNSQTVTAGGTATFTVTITAANGFNGVVTPSQTGFPAGTTVSYNPPTITGSGTMVITITTSTSTPPGTYPLAGSLTSGSIVHSGTLTLVVN